MFGNKPPSSSGTEPKPSLFGSTTSSAPTTSLFGTSTTAATTTTSQAPKPSLFGGVGLGTANTSQPASTQSTTTPTSGGLFGSAFGAKPSQPQGNPSPFGGLGASTTQPAQQSNTGGSLFGASQQQQTAAGGTGSLFGATTQPQGTAAPQQQSAAALSQSTNGTGRSAHFDHLLERGRKRNARENGVSHFDDLPTLQLGLGDIARKVRNLGTGGPSADQAQDRAAHYLLAASGVKTGSTLRDLNQFSTQAGLSAAGPPQTHDIDVDSYISNLHSQSTLALIQEGLEQSKRDFDIFLEEKVQFEWDAQRKRIYEHFGLAKQSVNLPASTNGASVNGGARGAFGRSTRKGKSFGPSASTNRMSFGASGPAPVLGSVMSASQRRGVLSPEPSERSGPGATAAPEDRFQREKSEQFRGTVKELNATRIKQESYPILNKFAQVEAQSRANNTQPLVDAYRALISITNEDSGSDASKERSFSKLYLDETPNSGNSVEMRKKILDGSRKFLEQQFLNQVEAALAKNPREAQLGGVPSTLNKTRGYIRIKLAFKELGTEIEHLQRIGDSGDEFPWVIVFYLLRSGLPDEAAQYVREKKGFFGANDKVFQAAIAAYAVDPDRRLSAQMQQNINNIYVQRARIAATNDPYRMACYKIIGRCEMTRRNLEPLKQTMEDWVWLQFNLAREGNRAEENAGENFGLEELRATIRDIGQRHFMSGSEAAGGYGVYFYLATLAGMFEQAVHYLYQHNHTSAVHFAIALAYYGLLRVSDLTSTGLETLTYSTRQQPQLNFGYIVGYYTQEFRKARPEDAAEYLILICLNQDLPGEAGKQQRELCHEALRELILETREFPELLGDMRMDGIITPGLIQKRLPLIKLSDEKAFLQNIIRQAAKMADDTGRTSDAVLLYHIAQEEENVEIILNRALSEAISVDLGQEPLRLEPLKPRTQTAIQSAQPVDAPSSTSLSMLAIEDPVELAQKIRNQYDANPQIYTKILPQTRNTLSLLLTLNEAKRLIEAGRYIEAVDIISGTDILPLKAGGSLPQIRSSANNFVNFAPEIARNIGNILMWTITCCGRHREYLLSSQYEDPTKRRIADQLLQSAKDLMVFAGLIRYKLPPRVFETLARAGQEAGIY
ncbi:NIC-domain-containing protein [Delitschia confertaspora ATCC 74209]|uniref:NIC-domain-containing protein n=1 Tax=Delitschia confertaspora ATCC 74209 TaxID=1513339 RepID=A0A9P4JTU3_9PLEO|nr:NIC-domain-containing protein [Delitschia confertaspora ATCC 74209]